MTANNVTTPAEDAAKAFVDLALPLETEPPTSAATSAYHSTPAALATRTSAATTTFFPGATITTTEESPEQDKTVAIVLVVAILAIIIVFTLVYVLYQKRRHFCGRSGARKKSDKPDLSANEVLITPVKANGGGTGLQSAPVGQLVSGPRESRPRQSVPRKWYDSAAMKYMDQSTDTLDLV